VRGGRFLEVAARYAEALAGERSPEPPARSPQG